MPLWKGRLAMKPEDIVVVGVAAAAAMTLTALGYVARVMFGAGAVPDNEVAGRGAGRNGDESITPERRRQMVAEHAYHRAAERGFANGDPLKDWLEAEREVQAELEESNRGDTAAH
jgi:Protein of unknown function (DUF2934)